MKTQTTTTNKNLLQLKHVNVPNSNLNYYAGSNGQIFSETKITKIVKPLKSQTRGDGYQFVNIVDNSQRKETGTYAGKYKNRTIMIHKLVASAFLNKGEYDGELVINHIDKNPSNNKITNLEIVSYAENKLHGSKKSGYSYTRKKGNSYSAVINKVYVGSFKSEEEASKACKQYFINNNLPIPRYARFAE